MSAGAPDLASLLGGGGGGPPGQIPVPGGGAAPDAGAGDQQGAIDKVTQAIQIVKEAIDAEPDHEDKLLLEKVATELQQYLAAQQKLTDQVMGAGTGAKAVRKATGGPPAGGGY
jgi:hypothetical protein